MVTTVSPAGPALVPAAGGTGYALKHPELPDTLSAVTNADLGVKLLELGINGADARPVLGTEKTVSIVGANSNAIPGVSMGAWLIPSQKRLIVAAGGEKTTVSGRLKIDLGKLGLMPANNGESIIYSSLETDQVLLQTTGVNRGKLLGLKRGQKDAEGRFTLAPADVVDVTVPAGACTFVMVSTQ